MWPVEFGREESRRALEDRVGALELGVLRFSRLSSADSSVVTPGRLPASTSAWRHHLRTASGVPTPSNCATLLIAAHSDS